MLLMMSVSLPLPRRAQRWLGHSRARLLVLPLLFAVFALSYPVGNHHWDVLERAWIVDHPGRYLHSFDRTPRSLFLHYAHVIELPLAVALGGIVPGAHGTRLLHLYATLCGVASVWLVGLLVVTWRRLRGAAARHDVAAAIVAQSILATSLAFWKLSAGGEEKALALATQLGFVLCLWRTLEAERPDQARRWGIAAAVALPLSILSHLTSAVLVPFAAIVVWWVRDRARRRALAIQLGAGLAVAGLAYLAVAAMTVGARTPADFWRYFTFYHHGVENFFELTGAPQDPGSRLLRVGRGIASFFSGPKMDGLVPAAFLTAWLVMHGTAAVLSRPRRDRDWMRPGPQVALLIGLWAMHFAFYEPNKYESWTLSAALAIVAAASLLPRGRWALVGLALPVYLIVVNVRHYRYNHQPFAYASYFDAAVRSSRPEDIVLLVGGRQDGLILRGSLWTRYFLSRERQRTVASLYDVTGLTEAEYWGRPFPTADSLQAELDRGRRAFAPSFFGQEFDLLALANLLEVTWEARGDSVIEITRVVDIPEPAGASPRLVTRPDPQAIRVALLPYRKPKPPPPAVAETDSAPPPSPQAPH